MSPNIVPFHMLGTLSSCVITLSLRRAVILTLDFKKFRDLEIRVRGHSTSLKVVQFDRMHMVSQGLIKPPFCVLEDELL